MNKAKCSLVFTGDIGFDRYMSGRWNASNLFSPAILDYCKKADHVIANVEGALYKAADDGSRGIFFHSMDPEAVCVLKALHADIWNISNNHIMDAGADGLISTCSIAASLNCRTIGAGMQEIQASEPVYLDEAGGIGIIGVAYMTECIPASSTEPGVFRWDNLTLIKKRIQEIKKKCRWCIVVSHGGEEFSDLPNPYTRNRYLKFLDFGADLVIAHHPHVPENYETFHNGKAIFYSLGNFVFDTDYQRAHPYTDLGILLKLIFTESEMKFEALGTQIVRGEEIIKDSSLPAIFTDICAEEYTLLSPLSAYAFLQEEMKKMIYLEPDRFKNASEDVWNSYFFSTEPDGYDKNAHMDLSVIVALANKVYENNWQKSRLDKVKHYIKCHTDL